MRAILELKLVDDIVVDEKPEKGPPVIQEVETAEHMLVDVSIDREEFKKTFQNTIATSVMSVFDKTCVKFERDVELARKDDADAKAEAAKKRAEAEAKKNKKKKPAPAAEEKGAPEQTDTDSSEDD
jgi:hypothetical protein